MEETRTYNEIIDSLKKRRYPGIYIPPLKSTDSEKQRMGVLPIKEQIKKQGEG